MTEELVQTCFGPRIVRYDEAHLAAHWEHLRPPRPEALRLAAEALEEASGAVRAASVEHHEVVGASQLVRLDGTQRAWWGYRPERKTPSHLTDAPATPTRWLTAIGRRDGEVVELMTLYAGELSPREIHDPDIPLDELDASIAFWTGHALAVRP